MLIDFSFFKSVVTGLKKDLRDDVIYGHNAILLRTKTNNYSSGYSGNDIYNIGFVSGTYTNTIYYGIKEPVPKGFTRRYDTMAMEYNGDVRFSVSKASGVDMLTKIKTNYEVWTNISTDISGNVILDGNKNPSGASELKMRSFNDDLLDIERVFVFDIKA